MAIISKVEFLNKLEGKLSTEVTADSLSRIMSLVSDTLEGFEMRSIDAWAGETDDSMQCYLAAMNVEGRSKQTINRYSYVLTRLMTYLGGTRTRQITVHHIRNFLNAEKSRGISDRTLEGYREIFSSYFNWLEREGIIDRNPVANLGRIKYEKKVRAIYSGADIERLSMFCSSIRDKAVIYFLASTGCRVSEMVELNRDAVDLNSLECIVRGKGNKERTVYMSDVAGMFLREYLAGRKDNNQALFLSKNHVRICTNGVRYILKATAERANIEHVHPHKFRRTLATNLAKHGMPIQEISCILGHEKLDTTMTYVALNKDDTKSSYRRYT